jgi:hypothetical protein
MSETRAKIRAENARMKSEIERAPPREQRILVKEFIQGFVLGLLAGFLAAWMLLG